MLVLTSWVPRAASWTLRAISLVAEPCSSIAAAIAVPIWSISAMTSATLRIAVTVSSLAGLDRGDLLGYLGRGPCGSARQAI
jgi:hypothetical protein